MVVGLHYIQSLVSFHSFILHCLFNRIRLRQKSWYNNLLSQFCSWECKSSNLFSEKKLLILAVLILNLTNFAFYSQLCCECSHTWRKPFPAFKNPAPKVSKGTKKNPIIEEEWSALTSLMFNETESRNQYSAALSIESKSLSKSCESGIPPAHVPLSELAMPPSIIPDEVIECLLFFIYAGFLSYCMNSIVGTGGTSSARGIEGKRKTNLLASATSCLLCYGAGFMMVLHF